MSELEKNSTVPNQVVDFTGIEKRENNDVNCNPSAYLRALVKAGKVSYWNPNTRKTEIMKPKN